MLAGDADAGKRSEAMLNGRGGACARRRGGGGSTSQPRADDVAPRRLGVAVAAGRRATRRVRACWKLFLLAAPPVPRPGALRRRLPRPPSNHQVLRRSLILRRQRRRTSGVELPDGRNQAVSGQPAPPPRQLPLAPNDAATAATPKPKPNGVVSAKSGAKALHPLHPRRPHR